MESDSLYTASMELTFFRNFIFDCLLGPWYLYADSVLIYFTVAIIIVIIMNLIIGLVFFVKEIRLKKLEEKMVREMLQIRNTSIQAKLIRYNVEACQKKNPTKTFTEVEKRNQCRLGGPYCPTG
ncbi:unnamed protein product [Heligmosomoides polygyrus]|uniref:Ion_trans domain-containing protein n=1 Tax=Heligmosomoides polygyrus TaxID=6339 RepID=A0A183G530_HELPZ|nr:unnamed protein product [Heligmosomoides polygyrus]